MASPLKAGDLDPSFGKNGRIDIVLQNYIYNELSNITAAKSGRILIYGTCSKKKDGTEAILSVAQLKPDGSIDTTFGDKGLMTAPAGIGATYASDLAVLKDGSFFTTGQALYELPLLRYSAEGKLTGQWDLTDDEPNSEPKLLVIEDKNYTEKVLVAAGNNQGGFIHRRNADGTADTYFGNNGKTHFLTGGGHVTIGCLARSAIASFYVGGQGQRECVILRCQENGQSDKDYDYKKMNETPFTIDPRICQKIIEDYGNIITLFSNLGESVSASLLRLKADGKHDPKFNGGEPIFLAKQYVGDCALHVGGKLLITQFDLSGGVMLARYLPNGEPDPEFGDKGKVTFAKDISFLRDILVQPDGKIIVAGTNGLVTTLFRVQA